MQVLECNSVLARGEVPLIGPAEVEQDRRSSFHALCAPKQELIGLIAEISDLECEEQACLQDQDPAAAEAGI
eukprot:125279-Amphidinium_carterae.1